MPRKLLTAAIVLAASCCLLIYGASGSRSGIPGASADASPGTVDNWLDSGDLSTPVDGEAAALDEQLAKNLLAQNEQQPRAARRAANRARRAADDPVNAEYLGQLVVTARDGGAKVLSTGDSYDDFVSIAEAKGGTLYAAYAAYYDGHDQIRLHRRLKEGEWSTRTHVPLVQANADIWMPQIAVDASDRLWVIWCEQTDQTETESGNWDLYARSLAGETWGELVRLTSDKKPDINPHVFTDDKRNIHVVWQSHPKNFGNISYVKFDGQEWGKQVQVTSDLGSDWYPHVAVDKEGTAWIVFDSYRNGDYDVFLTSVKDGQAGQIIPIAASPYYEAHACVACGVEGAVWIAWEQGGANWGKDQGHWLKRGNRNQGTTLGSTRQVKVACYRNQKLSAAPEISTALPDEERKQQPTAMAELAAGSNGRVWLRFRRMITAQPNRPRPQKGWIENVTTLTNTGWTPAVELPASTGRISVFSRIVPAGDGSLHVAYSGDARDPRNYHRPIQDVALVTNVPAPGVDPGEPNMSAYSAPAPPAGMPAWNTSGESKQVERIRNHRITIDGVPLRIVRGDLHRHTELSWDVGPGNDGSYLDFYRYMIDVASMDFGSLTDHQGGGHYPYWWWLTQKSADMFYLQPRFVPLYGYERSVKFPNGHRNVFHASRGVPVFPFQLKLDQTGVFPGTGTGEVVSNDTKLLYEFLHRTKGIAISHTSGTSTMGTDWRDNDPEIEPVVEMYQGARNSYETLDGPRVHPRNEKPDDAPGGFQEAGLVWKALEKGYRLGTITSSDHGSTHISYALVYTPEIDRVSILDSIRKRRTYGATDNIIIDFRAGEHFMGEEFPMTGSIHLRLHVIGTEKVTKVDFIRNGRYVLTEHPNNAEFTLEYKENEVVGGQTHYYARLEQANGEVAWSSPVWVRYGK